MNPQSANQPSLNESSISNLRSAMGPLLALVAVLAGASLRGQEGEQDYAARIEAAQSGTTRELGALTMTELLQRAKVPGVSVAVIKDSTVHFAKGYGLADAGANRPVHVDTLFQAASISKPVTAMATVRLAQDGRFSLDADINSLLTSWKVPASEHTRDHPVTPRSLSSHTSGADDGFGFPGYDRATPRPTLVQILNGQSPSNVGPVLFTRPPFQAYKYSGGSVTLMELALTDVTGTPFPRLMQELVLGPLHMTASTFEQPLPEPWASRAAHAHGREGQAQPAPWHVYPEHAAAGLWTTPTDLARFAIEVQRALRGPRGAVLTQASAREMTTPVGVGPYGVGLSLEKRGEGWYFAHGGSNWGFRCTLISHLRKGYGAVVMTNGDNGGQVTTEIVERVAAAYQWDMLDKPLPR
jgi:CubicO group peptidase (beta-lactamase class C family)